MIIDGILLLVLIGILVQMVRKKWQHPYRMLALWFAVSLFCDTLLTMRTKFSFFSLALYGGLFLIWLFTYGMVRYENRRLLSGFLVNSAILMTVIYIALLGVRFVSPLMVISYVSLGVMALVLLMFGGYALIVFFFWNAREVLKKESRTIANMLTLFLGIAGVVFILFSNFIQFKKGSFFSYLFLFLALLFAYYFTCFLTVLTSSLLCNLMKPRYDRDYLIVLGAGLLNGETVTPLLAGRIDRAIVFMNEQFIYTGKQAILLMSGGQGADEKVPESVAMKRYALEQGVLEENILTEEKSTTTWENLQFSKAIIEKRGTAYKSSFVSNEYHLFRAGIFARKLRLKSDGLGSKTARYFLPNAFIREFIAIVLMHKKRHVFANFLLLVVVIAVAVVNQFFTGK